MEMIPMIGKNIIETRKQKHLSQKSLANRTKISISNLRQLEKGDANPTLQTLGQLAEHLDVPLLHLLTPDSYKTPEAHALYALFAQLPDEQAEAVLHLLLSFVQILQRHMSASTCE